MTDTNKTIEEQKGDNWAEMSDEAHEEQAAQEEEKNHVIKPAQKIPAAQKGKKNKQGDYIVTTIDIPDIRAEKKEGDESSEDGSDSDTEYDEEDDVKAPVEEVKEGK